MWHLFNNVVFIVIRLLFMISAILLWLLCILLIILLKHYLRRFFFLHYVRLWSVNSLFLLFCMIQNYHIALIIVFVLFFEGCFSGFFDRFKVIVLTFWWFIKIRFFLFVLLFVFHLLLVPLLDNISLQKVIV